MDLTSLISQIETMTTDIVAGNLLSAWRDSINLQQTAINILSGTSVDSMAKSINPTQCTQLDAAVNKCKSAISAATSGTTRKSTQLDSLFPGDGTFLKNLAQFFLTIFPLIAPFLKPTPAPAG